MTAADISSTRPETARHSTAYNLFIIALTIFSLIIMVLLILPLNEETSRLLILYDAAICIVLLGDFAWNLARAPVRRHYFLREWGWLDLLGSIPSFGLTWFTPLLRLARISRASRILRRLGRENRRAILRDVARNRAEYAGLVTILLAAAVLVFASLIVVTSESNAAEGNIETGWDAFWWSFVTMTTVGYGDRYPVTVVGRTTAMFVMAMGIGIIGALASILASVLIGGGDEDESAPDALVAQIEALRAEVGSLTVAVEQLAAASMAADGSSPPGADRP